MSRRDSEVRMAGQRPEGRKLWGEGGLGQVVGWDL